MSRSVTRAPPSGRKAIAHGTRSPLASTVATTSGPPSLPAVADGVGKVGGSPAGSGSGSPRLHPAVTSSSVAQDAAAVARRRPMRGYGRRALTRTRLAARRTGLRYAIQGPNMKHADKSGYVSW
ncbi:hypothetical protein Misp04_42470 [Micromonospora sp. NBRC 101691]|nr:hypothetical protein Misp04_42470 [Micromonospora sp. NBRC 101691]